LAKKKKQEKPRRELTRRQRSRREQQKRRQRIILGAAILIVVAVLSVVGVGVYQGWYVSDVKPLNEVVLEVNGTEFDMEYFVNRLEFYTRDMDPVSVSYAAGEVIELIKRDELIRQEAPALGITYEDEEVDEVMNSLAPPLEEEFRDIAVAQLLLEKVRDDYLDEIVPKYADQRHIMAMFLEGEALANEVIDRIGDGESFSDIAAELSLDQTTKEAGGDLGWRPQEVLPLVVDSTVLEEAAFNAEVGALSPPIFEETKTRRLGYWLIEVIELVNVGEGDEATVEASVRRMLIPSEQEALDITARLEAGEDFAELAAEFSQDSATNTTGGTITVPAGTATNAFDSYVFDPGVEPGVLSPPIRDVEALLTGGYWLIEVVDSQANREIDEDNRFILKNSALADWVTALVEDPDNEIVNNLDEAKLAWAVAYVTGG
jgi:parvulin-like peptidyl-prolyl isomerase